MKKRAGFHYDTRRRSARLEVILPGTGAKVRRRRLIEKVSRDEALAAWKASERRSSPVPLARTR